MAGEAVRAALMFCFEESVLCACRRNPLLSVGPDAPIVCPEETPHIFAGLLTLWFSRRVRPEGGAGGNEGKRVPSGHNRRRRLATRSSGKQQAERTAVRTAPIVCPEESPPACIDRRQLCRKKFPRWGMTRRLRRGERACSPMERSIASGGDPKGTGGERNAPSAPAGAYPCPAPGGA